jgi:hypothetical protein
MTSTNRKVATLAVSENEASLLWCTATNTSCAKQIDRFEVLCFRDSDKNPLHADFDGGILYWCESVVGALVLRDFERASGYDANLLWDLWDLDEHEPRYVVESTRPWTQLGTTPDDVRALSSFVE